jgi:FAD/FMN-containing dehydrogenase
MTAFDPQPLRAIVGDAHVITDDLEPFEREWRGRYRGATLAAVRPKSAEEVAAVLRHSAAAGLAVVPQGGNTGMAANAMPPRDRPNIVLSLGRMNRIRDVDTLGNTITVEAGCTLAAVQEAAAAAGRLFPLTLGSQGSCQIGGTISTNAGGTAVLRYGNMRELVLGLEAVLPDGSIWSGLRRLRKDNTGYDLKQLFIGAEGTLGVVTAAVLKLFPAARSRAAAWIGLADIGSAVTLLGLVQARCGERLSTFEIMSQGQLDLVLQHVPDTRSPLASGHAWSVLVETTSGAPGEDLATPLQEALAEALEQGLIADAAMAASEAQAAAFWRLRESVSEANRASGYSVAHDTSVPIAQIPAFMEQATAALAARASQPKVVAVGHVGDGNIHLVAIFRRDGVEPAALQAEADAASADVHRIAVELGGSISAEHGIGGVKTRDLALMKSPLELALMRRIKAALDPMGMMNPGKVLPEMSEPH